MEQFSRSENPAEASLAKLGQTFHSKFKSGEICDTQALVGIAQALQSGIPAGPVSVAIATVGKNIMAGIMEGRHPKRGGFEQPLKMAETFVQSAASYADQGRDIVSSQQVVGQALSHPFNQIVAAEHTLNLLTQSGGERTPEQTTILLTRNIMQDSRFGAGDIGALGVPILEHLAAHSGKETVKSTASQSLADYQTRQETAFAEAEKAPLWVDSPGSLRTFERENEAKMLPALEQCYLASGPAPLPPGQAPEHRRDGSWELLAQVKQYLNS